MLLIVKNNWDSNKGIDRTTSWYVVNPKSRSLQCKPSNTRMFLHISKRIGVECSYFSSKPNFALCEIHKFSNYFRSYSHFFPTGLVPTGPGPESLHLRVHFRNPSPLSSLPIHTFSNFLSAPHPPFLSSTNQLRVPRLKCFQIRAEGLFWGPQRRGVSLASAC